MFDFRSLENSHPIVRHHDLTPLADEHLVRAARAECRAHRAGQRESRVDIVDERCTTFQSVGILEIDFRLGTGHRICPSRGFALNPMLGQLTFQNHHLRFQILSLS